jgi:ribonuclease HI
MNLLQTKKSDLDVFSSKTIIKNSSKIFPTCDYVLYFDGCSKGNPGPSGCGAVIYNKNEEIWASFRFIGEDKTNNQAEYSGLLLGLRYAIENGIKELLVFGDSKLIINQVKKVYNVKNKELLQLYNEVIELTNSFSYIEFMHVYRNNNKRADQLANFALSQK